jgi:hypothetical protein
MKTCKYCHFWKHDSDIQFLDKQYYGTRERFGWCCKFRAHRGSDFGRILLERGDDTTSQKLSTGPNFGCRYWRERVPKNNEAVCFIEDIEEKLAKVKKIFEEE